MTHAQNAAKLHLKSLGLEGVNMYYNLLSSEYEKFILQNPTAKKSAQGAIAIKTGEFTGRSPKDRYIVNDDFTENIIDWGKVNKQISTVTFNDLKQRIIKYLSDKQVFVHDAFVCADDRYKMNVRTIAENAYSALFASNMFRNFSENELKDYELQWTVICAPDFKAEPKIYNDLGDENFAILNFTTKEIIIGGTGYTGEIKKGIFSVLNCLLVIEHNVLPMHCSANVDSNGDAAVFFGLSGTGKTTLSADPNRMLVGDDEHGWGSNGIFNFEGGCYAKTINLTEEGEPQIFSAIKEGALLENVGFIGATNEVNYSDDSITENTRVSYPLSHIPGVKKDSCAPHPRNIFFLTCDAFGILPPISKLSPEQAMYYFISGYTAKVAGTELGVTEPEATFSACFGSPFLPLHPTQYAELLREKMKTYKTNVWLVNTGWIEGQYGEGQRISLKYTRSLITAAMTNKLDNVVFEKMEGFDLEIPTSCDMVPSSILNPRNTWDDKNAYDVKASQLAQLFQNNFKKFSDQSSELLKAVQPKVLVS